jgi:hypothetical protein
VAGLDGAGIIAEPTAYPHGTLFFTLDNSISIKAWTTAAKSLAIPGRWISVSMLK